MKEETRIKLQDAYDYCNDNDQSTEFMIQYMMDTAKVSHDCVMSFLYKKSLKQTAEKIKSEEDKKNE